MTLFLSCPGDVPREKEKLVGIVQEMSASFNRHGISLLAWTFEKDSVPAIARPGESVQTVIDRQMPRNADGSIAYHLFVGLMDQRIGTPLKDAPSGTVHEFLEAKKSFESTGKPHVLFYFRARDPQPTLDAQSQGVRDFRAQFPGLFASYTSIEDLETQFRRHLLTELLDLLHPDDSGQGDHTASEWWDRIGAQYDALRGGSPTSFLDNSSARVERMLRQTHLLFGSELKLGGIERRLLAAALFSLLLNDAAREQFEASAGAPPLSAADIHAVVARSLDGTKMSVRSVGSDRLDLLGALAAIGLRLDLSRHSIAASAGDPGENGDAGEWVAYLTDEIVCERGIVRFQLLAPSAAWIEPLIGATAVAMEALWQQTRTVLTRYGLSFAVARCKVDVDADVGRVSSPAFDLIAQVADHAAKSLPAIPHFGQASLPGIKMLLPLPHSKSSASVFFRAPMPGPLRLLVNGVVVAEQPESGVIEYLPPAGRSVDCILECDEGGAFVPVVESRLARLDPLEAAVLECAADRADACRSLGLWNEFLEIVWPGASSSEPGRENLSAAFHVLKDAFEAMSSAVDSLLDRRDMYWDAMEIIRKHLNGKENTP